MTNSEIIRELEKSVATLVERVDNLRAEIARVEKALEESDRKRWNLTMGFVSAVLALASGIILSFLRK